MTTNEAAERLRREWSGPERLPWNLMLNDALAAERRATVERIRARLNPGLHGEVFMLVGDENVSLLRTETVSAILDQEAAR